MMIPMISYIHIVVMMQRNQWFLSTDPPSLPKLSTSSIPPHASVQWQSIQQKLWEQLYFCISLTLLDRSPKSMLSFLWNNRWWKCYEKLSQPDNGRAGACPICLVQFSRRKVQIYLDGILSLQLLFSFQGTQSEDSARLEMRLLRTSAHQQNQQNRQTGK